MDFLVVLPFLGLSSLTPKMIFPVSIRLKSVKNIQKITKSMKMIAAVKYARAERELRPARPFGEGAQGRSCCYSTYI